MIKMTLEECSKLLDEINVKRKNLEELKDEEMAWHEEEVLSLEKMHQQMIAKLANNNQTLEDVLVYLEDEDKKIVGQAFLIIIESKNKIIIQKMIEKYLFDKDKRYDIFQYLVYVSEDGFDILFNTLKKIGFDKTEFHKYVMAFLLKYIQANSLKEYLEIFYKLDNFSEDLQEKILNNLRYFEEFHGVVIQAYKDKHPYFFKDNQYIVETTPFSLLLQKEDTLALNILRQDENIWHGDDVMLDLILHGNKEDGKVIADALMRFVKDNKFQDSSLDLAYWLYQKLDYTLDISSPLLYENILEIFRLNLHYQDSFEELTSLLEYKLSQQFGYFEFKEANSQYTYWLKHPKKDKRKKYLSDSLPISPQLLVLNTLMSEASHPLAPTISYEELIITTGQYFPLNSGGYYSTLKEHAQVWLDYLEKNKEKYEAGRWIRYGKYVD